MRRSSTDERVRLDIRRAIVDGRFATARSLLDRQFARSPADGEVYMLAGRLASAERDPARELEMMRAAVAREPANGEYLALLGRCHGRAQQVEAALACVEAALALPSLNDLALDALASILSQLGRHKEAAGLLRRAVDEGSTNAAIHFNLGNNLKFTGDFAGARVAFERALVLAPRYHKAHAALTSLGGITAESNNLSRLETMIPETDDPRISIHLHHAAAKECEALSRFDEAWRHLEAGKSSLLSVLPTDPLVAVGAMDQLTAIIGSWLPEVCVGEADGGPILIVGMPRSGTTVLDRIISNHDDVTSIGESLYFAQQLKRSVGSTSRDLLDQPMLDALVDGTDLTSSGERYMAHSRKVSRGSPRFVDKFHLNFMLGGHLLRAMPTARILCVVRNPLDTIVSNFRQLFEFESTLYSYSLDLTAATEFYIRFRQLAALLEAFAPKRFRVVSYEELVADPETMTTSLLDFCDLRPQAGCSAIERNGASVATASAVQVRAPIHAGSIGSWRRYDRHLGAAIFRLKEEGLLAAGHGD